MSFCTVRATAVRMSIGRAEWAASCARRELLLESRSTARWVSAVAIVSCEREVIRASRGHRPAFGDRFTRCCADPTQETARVLFVRSRVAQLVRAYDLRRRADA